MANEPANPPPLSHMLETAIYCHDLEKSVKWYKDIFGFETVLSAPGINVFGIGNTALIMFQLGGNYEDQHINREKDKGVIPKHGPTKGIVDRLMGDSSGTTKLGMHYCIAAPERADVDAWEKRLVEHGVEIVGHMEWALGGKSVYFLDGDGHLGEIASKGIWKIY